MNIDEIVAWFNTKRRPALTESEAITLMSSVHPRAVFVKTLPYGAQLLDVGAGGGGLEVFRKWPAPPRADLKMYAYSLEKSERFDVYDGFELGKWESGPPAFRGIKFNAMFCAHFIEHIVDPIPFIEWTARSLPAGGRLYIEWPSPFSALLPRNTELAKRGVKVTISNVHDDGIQKVIHDRSKIVNALTSSGFFLEQQSYVSLPFLEEEILAHTQAGMRDAYAVQTAYWSKTRWSQYLTAVRR